MATRFADLVPELVADLRRSPDPASVELEALGFAMTLERMAEQPGIEAAEVVAALRGEGSVESLGALRVFGLYGGPVVRSAAAVASAELPDDLAVGTLAPAGVWRAESPDVAVHLAWLSRPGPWPDQSFTLVTGPDRFGAPLLGGGMGTAPEDEDAAAWRDAMVAALGTGAPVEVPGSDLLDRLARGAGTNAAAVVEVSAALAMGARIASVALGGGGVDDPAVALAWSLDETESDDERASYLQRLLLAAVADGVDPDDRLALASWTAELQQRRPREQLRRLGLAGGGDLPEGGPDGPPAARARPGGGDAAAKRAKRKAQRKARKRNR